MLKDKTLTYISLFSSAGVGCYGFKQEGYKCIATNELSDRRLDVQRWNSKCEMESGYIPGDLSDDSVKRAIYKEINKWVQKGNDRVDVVVATPPCQGISVINHKKVEGDLRRNSLVIESVEIVKKINPRFFIFENVMAFQKTLCETSENEMLPIGDYIEDELNNNYVISGRILNFMNYGSCSSRTRTVIIGVAKEYKNTISPLDLFPHYRKEKTLRDIIGGFPSLEWGEISKDDFFHAFRTYKESMRPWIHDLREGESAFDNSDPAKRPHRIVNGKRVENIRKNRDKYTRQRWDRFPQCIHTRNDQLAAQNTIHPEQDRVFSIREIMALMTVPDSFKWTRYNLEELNEMDEERKRLLYKKHEINIRQCLGEAVPTGVMREIATLIKSALVQKGTSGSCISKVIADYDLTNKENLIRFIDENEFSYSIFTLMKIAEMSNAKRRENAAFYTNKYLVGTIVSSLPSFSKSEMRILEPSVGAGSFLPYLFVKYADVGKVSIDVVDIDQDSLDVLSVLLKHMKVPQNFEINLICGDFLLQEFDHHFDLAIGNPPFSKVKRNNPELRHMLVDNINQDTSSIAEMFLEKCLRESDYVSLVLNKNILSSPEFDSTRAWLRTMKIERVTDFARYGFTGVSIETVNLEVSPNKKPSYTMVINVKDGLKIKQRQNYITDQNYPCFLLYRDEQFDSTAAKLEFGLFDVFRDRQITKANSSREAVKDGVWTLKAKNIGNGGSEVLHIPNYDIYVEKSYLESLAVSRFVDNLDVYLTPNMTYKPRVIRNPGKVAMDGSVAVLVPKKHLDLTDEQLEFFSTDEYRVFYKVARNKATQSINIDRASVYFYGVLR